MATEGDASVVQRLCVGLCSLTDVINETRDTLSEDLVRARNMAKYHGLGNNTAVQNGFDTNRRHS